MEISAWLFIAISTALSSTNVTPAKAGAQGTGPHGSRPPQITPQSRALSPQPAHLRCNVTWVPACAGMTSREVPAVIPQARLREDAGMTLVLDDHSELTAIARHSPDAGDAPRARTANVLVF